MVNFGQLLFGLIDEYGVKNLTVILNYSRNAELLLSVVSAVQFS